MRESDETYSKIDLRIPHTQENGFFFGKSMQCIRILSEWFRESECNWPKTSSAF